MGYSLCWTLAGLTAVGVVYQLLAAISVRRFFAATPAVVPSNASVTLLKPLYGTEPRLLENLSTFLRQDHRGALQMICGIQRSDDPATHAVARLKTLFPDADIALVVDPTIHGASGKVSNLVNMMRVAKHDLLVLSDSDISVAPDYLSRVLAALDRPGVGAVTCLYRGRGDSGFWSRFGAAGQTYQFIIGVVIATTYRLATPCMGSTIALTRATLQAIGGFERFADTLADDHAIGQAIVATRQSVVVPPMIITHAFDEPSAAALWRHELRWSATVRDIAFWPYVGAIVCNPLPLALLATLRLPSIGTGLIVAAALSRWSVVRAVDAATGGPVAPVWMAWLHDLFGFAVYFASFFVQSVDWRGTKLRMKRDGQVSSGPETSA